MDADGHIIPIVEGDQGEGFKDVIDTYQEMMDGEDELARRITEKERQMKSVIQETLEKGKTENEMLQLILDRLDKLERLVNQIFDGHVLIDGRFTKI